jgi:hypothetical protein
VGKLRPQEKRDVGAQSSADAAERRRIDLQIPQPIERQQGDRRIGAAAAARPDRNSLRRSVDMAWAMNLGAELARK